MRTLIQDVGGKIGESVQIYGWAQNIRILGSIIFIEVRDVSGKVQCVLLKKGK
ncbi:MAG: OB-fold nucleic acid binding domain-containing protein [Thermoplasmatales archaeon]